MLLAIAAASLVVLAHERVNATVPDAGLQAGPIPTYTTAPVPPLTVKRNSGADLNVLFAGDSLTGGLYASTQGKAFKWLMLDSLNKSGPVQEFNSALVGGTTLQVSEKYAVPANLDLAVIELGTNDQGNQVPMAKFTASYQSLIDRVKAGSPHVTLECAGIWEANGGSPSESAYDVTIRDICEKAGGRFVSLRTIYQEGDTIGPAGEVSFNGTDNTGTSDDFHPNDKGHEQIASALLNAISVQK